MRRGAKNGVRSQEVDSAPNPVPDSEGRSVSGTRGP
jgi:hypothetical protein